MGKALLINPSYARTYGSNEGGIAFPVYPVLGLAAVGGALRDAGHEFRILDLSYRPYDPELIRSVIRQEKPDIVGVTATTPLMNQLRDISFIVKDISPDIMVVGGGAHPSALPIETLRESAMDVVAAGEHDFTLARILDGTPLGDVPGIYWREHMDGEIRHTGPCTFLHDLDELPVPAWESYPPEYSSRITKIIARYSPVTTIEFSRGCVFKCEFCASKNTMGLGHRRKSPERCAEELRRVQSLGYREVVLMDDIFTTNRRWAMSVCEEIIRRGIKVAWTCTNGIRVDSCDPELFDLMKRAGCYRVYFGFESGSDEVLKAFGKGGQASLQKGVEAVKMARDAGFEPSGFFLMGLSGDTEQTMQQTIDYARNLKLDVAKCGITVPFPGTPMFEKLHSAGAIRTYQWDRYNLYQDAEPVFDHPNLDWPVIYEYVKKFYTRLYFRNPSYLWRRLLFMVRNMEVFWNVYYAIKFWMVQRRESKLPSAENYAYSDRWRKLDISADDIGSYARRPGGDSPPSDGHLPL